MKIYNKLVRDKIPKIIEDSGNSCSVRALNDEDYFLELKKKLVEESSEALDAKNDFDLMQEIADIYEVIDSIIDFKNFDKSGIIKIQNLKREKRGAFSKRIFLEDVNE